MNGKPLLLILLLALGLGAVACDDDPVQVTELAQIRAVHASPDAPAVDVYVEGVTTPLFTDVAYGEATDYFQVEAGTYNIQLRPAGAAASTDPVFETGDVTLGANVTVTALAAGLLNSMDAADRFRIIPLAENFGATAANSARVRVVHASPDAPTVDIDVGDDGTSEITGLARWTDTGESGVDLPAGQMLEIGIIASGVRVTGFTTPALSNGVEYFLIATGLIGKAIGEPDAFVLRAVDENSQSGAIEQNVGMFQLRAVHASPDAPAVDVYAEGSDQPLFINLAYGEVTDYIMAPEGDYNIQLRGAGSPATSAPVYETGNLTLSEGDIVTAIATGFLASGSMDDQFRILPLFEDFDAVASGTARVRIVHAAPDAPTVAVDVGNDGTPEISDLARFAETGAGGVELPAATALQIGIWAGNPLARVTAFTTPQLPDGGELFVIAIGSLADRARESTGFSLMAVAPTGLVGIIKQNPVVYALHGGPDAPAVDIFWGNVELADNLAFGQLSAAIQVPAGTYTLDFFPTSAGSTRPGGSPAASFDTPDLMAGGAYLAVAAGELSAEGSEAAFTLIPAEEMFDATTMARVRAIHASGDAPAVDIGTVDAGTGDINAVVFGNVSFGDVSAAAGAEVPVATLTLGVAPTGAATPVATFDVTTSAGLQAFAVAAGALAPDGMEEAFRLILVVVSSGTWQALEVMPN
jgi:hypothetical protein